MANINESIKLASGFLLKNAPVDLKATAATIEERNSYVAAGANVLYKGAVVYVEADDTFYVYTGVEPTKDDYSACFKPLLDGLATDSTVVKIAGAQTISGAKTFSEVITANKGLTATGDSISVNGKKLSSLAAPTADTDAATKAYVDALKQGLVVKSPVRAATTANIDATYANGTAGVGATLTGAANGALAAIDGVTLAVGQRVLVKNQTDAKQNGIYVVTKIGSGTEAFVLTRASDFDNSVEGSVQGGAYCFVQEGTVNADCGYVCSTDGAIVLGTSNVAFVQFSGAGLITAGNGLVKEGNTLSAKGVANQITVTEGGIGIDPKYQESITKLGTITQGVWNGTAVDVAHGGTGAITKEAGFAALAPAGANKGDLMYFDGTKWVALAKGEGVLVADENGVSYQTTLAAGTF